MQCVCITCKRGISFNKLFFCLFLLFSLPQPWLQIVVIFWSEICRWGKAGKYRPVSKKTSLVPFCSWTEVNFRKITFKFYKMDPASWLISSLLLSNKCLRWATWRFIDPLQRLLSPSVISLGFPPSSNFTK